MSASHTPGRIVSTDNVTLAKAIYGEESPEYALFRLEAERDALKALNAELVQALKWITPLAEAYLLNAPTHPDHAKLESARAVLAKVSK